jgi:lysophospholipase L1-like esterase
VREVNYVLLIRKGLELTVTAAKTSRNDGDLSLVHGGWPYVAVVDTNVLWTIEDSSFLGGEGDGGHLNRRGRVEWRNMVLRDLYRVWCGSESFS